MAPSAVLAGRLVLFGGEVDPSEKGHEGAGGFAQDVVEISADGKATSLVATDASAAVPCCRGNH